MDRIEGMESSEAILQANSTVDAITPVQVTGSHVESDKESNIHGTMPQSQLNAEHFLGKILCQFQNNNNGLAIFVVHCFFFVGQ